TGTPAGRGRRRPRRDPRLGPLHHPGDLRAVAVRTRSAGGDVSTAFAAGTGMGGQARPTSLCDGDVQPRGTATGDPPSQGRRRAVVRARPGNAPRRERVRAVL